MRYLSALAVRRGARGASMFGLEIALAGIAGALAFAKPGVLYVALALLGVVLVAIWARRLS